jgi:hypothetical protein
VDGAVLPLSVFSGEASVSIEIFLDSLVELNHALTSDSSMIVVSACYLNRMLRRGMVVVSWNNVFRLLLACTLCAVKYHADELLYNGEYARLIGLSLQDVNSLELGILNGLKFELYASNEEFAHMGQVLIKQCQRTLTVLL